MGTFDEIETEGSSQNDEIQNLEQINLDEDDLNKIFENLSENSKIIFKSQQIDDPEISKEEKISIAKITFQNEGQLKFLRKFGRYLTEEHVKLFQENLPASDDQYYEIKYLLDTFLSDLEHRKTNIKNRRFVAMKKMIVDQNEYFSEREMMKREPVLYEQLIGQYLTEKEKNIRDGYNPKTTLFSEILLNTYDREQEEKIRKENEIKDYDDESTQTSIISQYTDKYENMKNKCDSEIFPSIPPSFKMKWGEFEDENQSIDQDINQPGTSNNKNTSSAVSIFQRNKKMDAKQVYVTANEKEMLKEEFYGIMRSKFIDGDETFDYCDIDDNTDLDDIDQINQDCEDKYFDDDDDDDEEENFHIKNDDNMSDEDDDLDMYMKSLNKMLKN